jgi:Tfp pilus tip-associated adhesin PilY1
MVFIATGRYLDESDTSSTVRESIWGIVDHALATPTDRAGVTPCTIAVSGVNRTSSCTNRVSSAKGWVIDLPLAKERVTVNPVVRQGAVIFASNAPKTTDVCKPVGDSYLYYVDISNGGAVPAAPGGRVGHSLGNLLAVGLGVVEVAGVTKAFIGGIDGVQKVESPLTKSGSAEGKRVNWRELIR